MIKKIGVLTSGGDSPGMNTAITAIIRTCAANNIEIFGVIDGFKGLVNGWFKKLDLNFAQDIIALGGTKLGSARMPEFTKQDVRLKAVNNLKLKGIEALIVIGGDGSYMGAQRLTEMGIKCVGLPGTIDNDIASSDYTIGFDTSLNTIVESIDKIRDTLESHHKIAVVEVMGNQCGDLALYAGTATGCEVISTSESKLTVEEICRQSKNILSKGKKSLIILVSENIYDINDLVKKVENSTGFSTRLSVLGHIQRGGKPTGMDRYLATNAAIMAVEKIMDNNGGVYIGMNGNKLVARDITATLNMVRPDRTNELQKIRLINSQAMRARDFDEQ